MQSLHNIKNDISNETVLQFQNLTYNINVPDDSQKSGFRKRTILNNLSGYFQQGLNAILGSSGAGKTTLLNILAKKIQFDKSSELIGKLAINNYEYTQKDFRKFAGYVMQDDLLLSNLTVKEYIQFAADIKLESPQEERIQKTLQIIKLLQLERCQNTLIGNEMVQGISGGERKRTSIGLELIGEPSVLFLDEPTSGLDSFTAYRVMQILKTIAEKKNSTIIFTIHQPPTDIWNLFNRVSFLAEGQFIYQGQREQVIDYFSSIGFQCPIHSNPPDFIMRVIAQNSTKYEEMWKSSLDYYNKNDMGHKYIVNKTNVVTLNTNAEFKNITTEIDEEAQTYNQKQSSLTYVPSNLQPQKSYFEVTKILLSRQMLSLRRHKIMIRARLLQVIIMSLFNLFLFMNLDSGYNNYKGILQRASMLYLYPLGMLFQSINPQVISFAEERPVFLKEQSAGMYTTLSYLTSKILPELLSCTFFGILFCAIFYFGVGLRQEAESFFFFTFIVVLISNVGNSMGFFFGSVFRAPRLAISLAATLTVPFFLFGGLLKNRADYPTWIGWFQYINPTFYAWDAVIHNEFDGLPYVYKPQEIYHLSYDKWTCVGALIALYFGFLLAAYVCLRRHTKKQLQ